MNHGRRGIAVIFNNEKFKDDKLKQRVGAAEDGRELYDTLKGIGFDVRLYNDKKLDDMWEVINKVAKEDHTNHDCLLVAFMTHGEDNDYLFATDYTFKIDEVVERFKSDRVPSLAGKPKIFLIQACRGKKMDESAQSLKHARISETADPEPPRYFSLPTTADLLFLYSSMK
ncbi:hypothetical protein J437_LFUL012225, partial [Ladona fulva]